MAFKRTDLSVLAYANNFTLWHYVTEDGPEYVEAPGYFNGASGDPVPVEVNDLIIVNMDINGQPETKFYTVTGNNGGGVTVRKYLGS